MGSVMVVGGGKSKNGVGGVIVGGGWRGKIGVRGVKVDVGGDTNGVIVGELMGLITGTVV